MGKASKDKGKRGEREIVNVLQPIVTDVYSAHGLDVPHIQRNHMQTDRGGYDIVGVPWLAPEVKYVEQESLDKWWAQTLRQARPDQVPVLFYRKNSVAWNVMLYGMVGEPTCGYTVPVVIPLAEFLKWFRYKLNKVLTDEQ